MNAPQGKPRGVRTHIKTQNPLKIRKKVLYYQVIALAIYGNKRLM